MATKPADFFIGVVEFFSIVLPGALLSFLFLDFARQNLFGNLMPTLEGPAANWIAFALASYLLGHFASLVGARVLDSIYDWTYVTYKRRKGDHLYDYALELKAKSLGARKNIANAYKWARANARQRSASGMQEIDRLEADSKFFRSVTVVLAVFAVVAAGRGTVWAVALPSVLLVLSFWRFADLRWKGTEAAYLCLVVLETGRAPEAKTASMSS